MKLFIEMSHEELSKYVDLAKITSLKVGDKVTHKNAGKSAGSSGLIPACQGTVVSLHNQGLYSWGGLCVVVGVKWDNEEEYPVVYDLLNKV